MFGFLSDKLQDAVSKFSGQGKITEKELDQRLRELRLALLEGDVHFQVARDFIKSVREKAVGQQVLESLTPGQMVIKIFKDELTRVMGGEASELNLDASPPVPILFVGLQGAGKTTTVAKMAKYLKEKMKRSPYLVSVDVYRPAALTQLQTVAGQVGVPCYPTEPNDKPVKTLQKAMKQAVVEGCDTLLIDTAGRLAIDDEMMKELVALKKAATPQEILYVADVMTGQDAVQTTSTFHDTLGLTGVILTKMDGDARGGAALSIKEVTGAPIKFVGNSEKVSGLEVFHPDRMASRILDLGDVMTLIERAEEQINQDDAEEMAEKFARGEDFNLDDFQKQLKMIKKLGSFDSIMKMIPGMGKLTRQLGDLSPPEKDVKRIEAILSSMTVQERKAPRILNGSRRKRIASGSGTTVQDVNRLLKQFQQAQKMMKQFQKMGFKGLPFS